MNTGGFLKLDSSELKPIAGTTTLAPVDPNSGFSSFGNSSGASSEANENEGRDLSEQVNHNESQTNLFLQFLNRTRYMCSLLKWEVHDFDGALVNA